MTAIFQINKTYFCFYDAWEREYFYHNDQGTKICYASIDQERKYQFNESVLPTIENDFGHLGKCSIHPDLVPINVISFINLCSYSHYASLNLNAVSEMCDCPFYYPSSSHQVGKIETCAVPRKYCTAHGHCTAHAKDITIAIAMMREWRGWEEEGEVREGEVREGEVREGEVGEGDKGKENISGNQEVTSRGQEVTSRGQEVTSRGQEITSRGQEVTSRGQEITSRGQEVTSRGQEATSRGQEVTSRGQEVTSRGQEVTSRGQEVTSRGQEVTSRGQEVTSRGQEVTSRGQEVTSRGQEVTSRGQEVTSRGQEVTLYLPEGMFSFTPLAISAIPSATPSATSLTPLTPLQERGINKKKILAKPKTEVTDFIEKFQSFMHDREDDFMTVVFQRNDTQEALEECQQALLKAHAEIKMKDQLIEGIKLELTNTQGALQECEGLLHYHNREINIKDQANVENLKAELEELKKKLAEKEASLEKQTALLAKLERLLKGEK